MDKKKWEMDMEQICAWGDFLVSRSRKERSVYKF